MKKITALTLCTLTFCYAEDFTEQITTETVVAELETVVEKKLEESPAQTEIDNNLIKGEYDEFNNIAK